MPEFDFHAAIKELAEAELPCPCPYEQRHAQWLVEHGMSLWRTPKGTWQVDDEEARWDVGRKMAEADTAEEAVLRAALAWLKEQANGNK